MSYHFNWPSLWAEMPSLLGGLWLGLWIAAIALSVGIVLGVVGALLAHFSPRFGKLITTLYTGVIRNTPILILIYIGFFGLPLIGIKFDAVPTFIITLSLYATGYMIEVFRSGLAIIPRGLSEAGLASGMSRRSIVFSIELPLMIRNVLPSLSNYLISLFKDTSIASAIAVPELTYLTRKITTDTFAIIEPWIAATAMYVISCYVLAYLLRRLERKLAVSR